MMLIQDFYTRIGGDYAEVLRRLGNELRIKKILGMLVRDGSMQELCKALKEGDYETAFRAAHTLKGIAMNLGLTRLAEADAELTETLRPGRENEQIEPQFGYVQQCYTEAIEAIAELLAGDGSGKEGEEGVAAK